MVNSTSSEEGDGYPHQKKYGGPIAHRIEMGMMMMASHLHLHLHLTRDEEGQVHFFKGWDGYLRQKSSGRPAPLFEETVMVISA